MPIFVIFQCPEFTSIWIVTVLIMKLNKVNMRIEINNLVDFNV